MAKRASRNLSQLRKDNRTSNLPLVCSHKGCDNDFYVSRSSVMTTTTRECAACFAKPPQGRSDKATRMLRSLGLIA